MKSKTFAIIGFIMLAVLLATMIFPSLFFVTMLSSGINVYLIVMGIAFLMAIILYIIEAVKNRKKEKLISKTFSIIGFIMLYVAVMFLLFAANHPSLGSPFPLEITRTVYKVYPIVMGIIFLVAVVFNAVEHVKRRKI